MSRRADAVVRMITEYPVILFFFQAGDGIRGRTVTGVQTCALPIYRATPPASVRARTEAGGVARSATSRRAVRSTIAAARRGWSFGEDGRSASPEDPRSA